MKRRSLIAIGSLAFAHAVVLLGLPLFVQLLGFSAVENRFLHGAYGALSYPLDAILNKLSEKHEIGGEVIWPLFALNSLGWGACFWIAYQFAKNAGRRLKVKESND